MGSLCQSTVYLLGGRRRFLFFFARLPIIVHEQRPPSFSTPLLVRRAFLVARSRERGRGREGEAASTRRYNSLFCAKVLGPLSLMGGSRGLFWRALSWGEGNRGGGYLLIAGDFAFLRSDLAAAAAAVGLFCSIVLEFYYRDTTH